MSIHLGNRKTTEVKRGNLSQHVYLGSSRVFPEEEIEWVDIISTSNNQNVSGLIREELSYRGYDYLTVEEMPFAVRFVRDDGSPSASAINAFNGMKSLIVAPIVDTSQVSYINGMFLVCSSLTSVPQMDTTRVTSMASMFSACSSLTSVPQMDTTSVTNMASMFSRCSSLTSVPQMDTTSVTNMSYMFSSCSSLTSVPQMDTISVTNMFYMFSNCVNLTDGNVFLIGKNPSVRKQGMIYGSGLTREPFYDENLNPID